MSTDVSNGVWQRVVDPRQDEINDVAHRCLDLPSPAGKAHGDLWSCDCGRGYRVNRRGNEVAWVTGGPLNSQQALEQVFDAPHVCQPPVLSAGQPIGNGSTWLCACGKSFRVNRRGEHVSWANA